MLLPTWELIRASGLTSFFLLFLSIIGGLLLSLKIIPAKSNKAFHVFHQSTGWFALLFGLFHGLLLTIDHYQPFSLIEILIPFTAKDQPLLNGIGTISLYFMMVLFLSADLLKKIGANVWKMIHRLSLPCFVFLSIHGILLGTDTEEMWAIILYTSTLVMVFSMLIVKLLLVKTKSKANTKAVRT